MTAVSTAEVRAIRSGSGASPVVVCGIPPGMRGAPTSSGGNTEGTEGFRPTVGIISTAAHRAPTSMRGLRPTMCSIPIPVEHAPLAVCLISALVGLIQPAVRII
jgi:hypothetical protein